MPLKMPPPGSDGSNAPRMDPPVTLTMGGASPLFGGAAQRKARNEMKRQPGTNAAILLVNISVLSPRGLGEAVTPRVMQELWPA